MKHVIKVKEAHYENVTYQYREWSISELEDMFSGQENEVMGLIGVIKEQDQTIAALSAEVERLRGALEGISAIAGGWCDNCRAILDIARRAMEGGR